MKNYTEEELRAMTPDQLQELLDQVESEIEMLQRDVDDKTIH